MQLLPIVSVLAAFAAIKAAELKFVSNDEKQETFFDDERKSGCTAPSKFVANIVEMLPRYKTEVYGKMYYDAVTQQIRIIETVKVKGRKHMYDVLYLPKQKVEYIIIRKLNKCFKRKISRKFWPIHVSAGATKYGTYSIGTVSKPKEGVQVSTYGGKDRDGDRYFFTVTTNGCVPISAGGISRRMGFSSMQFLNVTLGIRDRNIFNVPAICNKREELVEDIQDENV